MKKNNNNNNYYYYDEHSASFATRQSSTLKTFSGHLKDTVSHKNTQYQKVCVYLNLSVYISRDFSPLVAIEILGSHFFRCHPYIETTTVLSDKVITA